MTNKASFQSIIKVASSKARMQGAKDYREIENVSRPLLGAPIKPTPVWYWRGMNGKIEAFLLHGLILLLCTKNDFLFLLCYVLKMVKGNMGKQVSVLISELTNYGMITRYCICMCKMWFLGCALDYPSYTFENLNVWISERMTGYNAWGS